MEIVEIALQGEQDLLQGIERRLLLAGLVRGEHRLGDPCGVGDLVLPFTLAVAEPA